MSKNSIQAIVDYYEYCESNYRTYWDLDRSLAMHLGYWDETTSSLSEALRRENEVMAELAGVTSADRVLDAGCGMGGTSIFLAEKYGCQVVGITLCENQTIRAAQHARKSKLNPPPQFATQDFTNTSFPAEGFDLVMAIESVCHSRKKADFITEAFRLLKKGGRLALADGFRTQKQITAKDKNLLEACGEGWAGCSWDVRDVFEKKLKKTGFEGISYHNVTKNVFPSLKLLYDIYLSSGACSRSQDRTAFEEYDLPQKLQFKNCVSSGLYQFQCYKKNLLEYGLFFARKSS